MFRAASLSLAALVSMTAFTPSQATVLAENYNGFDMPGGDRYYYGQSFTVEGTGAFNNVTISFFTGYGASIPSASGNIYLYSSALTGTVSDLGKGANFLGSAAAANNMFSFAPSLTVNGGTKYYAYLDAETPSAQFSRTNPYLGGEMFEASRGTGLKYQQFSSFDFRFGIGGSPMTAAVPEPASWAMMLIGFGALGGALRNRRKPVVAFA